MSDPPPGRLAVFLDAGPVDPEVSRPDADRVVRGIDTFDRM